ncbi:MAG: radical SAM family heme chaperone HemW [Xanthomonadales bacterium]
MTEDPRFGGVPEPCEDARLGEPPLALYVHLPWCVRKCPYCDFNSHEMRGALPADDYIDALLRDLELELPLVWGRVVRSVFLGGGTPSLFGARPIDRLLSGIRSRLTLAPDAEITLEANPGTIEHDSFTAYRSAGVNRVSLGVQSFDDALLARIGRIHGRAEAVAAVESLAASGIDNFNLDLMYALPGQGVAQAEQDLRTALSFAPPHVSHYQLTIEPNTLFHRHRPDLPDDDLAVSMQERCEELLDAAGLGGYEISAHARAGRACRHNLNYWQYGDFIGIGAGAHGKISLPARQAILRRVRSRHPRDWMRAAGTPAALAEERDLPPAERVFEFFLNHLRLRRGVRKTRFSERTGAPWSAVESRIDRLVGRGLLEDLGDRVAPTATGWRFVNDLQAEFLP